MIYCNNQKFSRTFKELLVIFCLQKTKENFATYTPLPHTHHKQTGQDKINNL